jgi:hypothetical protein
MRTILMNAHSTLLVDLPPIHMHCPMLVQWNW